SEDVGYDSSRSITPPVREDGRHDEPEKYPVAKHHVVEQLAVGSRERERDGPRRLNHDSSRGRPIPGMQPRRKPEEESVGRHRLQHARRGENSGVDEPDSRYDDAHRHYRGTDRAHHYPHGVSRRRQAGSEAPGAERSKIGDV